MADKKPVHKKRKLEPAKRFSEPNDIRQSLRAGNSDIVVESLNQLRNQLTIRLDEGIISPQDERLLLVERWLEKDSGAQDIFTLWENGGSPKLQVAVVTVLIALLSLLSSHYTYYALGHPIVKSLLSPQWMKRLNSYVVGGHNELTLVTLKLLNVVSGFAGGREKKTLLEVFQWEIKSLPKLLTLRRKGKDVHNPLLRPDIRSLYIQFLLSFLDGQVQVKSAFLEQHRDKFLAIFKGLPQDHFLFIRHVLEAIWTNLWSDPKLKRTTKIGLFNESSISHLLKIYERTNSSDEDQGQIPADLIHHFLLAIMTRPGVGICFRDHGWYPRDDSESEKAGKIHNKVLANVLKTLKVNEDARQQELARRILEACPELVAGYWSSAQLTLEPRLSTKWIANIAFLGTIISLPIPHSTFLLAETDLYNPTPPPLQNILSNILPSDISPKSIFTKGLLSSSGLVQHCAALTLAKCLMKYAQVLEIFRGIEEALEVGETEDGLWTRRRRDVEKEVRRRVPEFQVILGFSQQKPVSAPINTSQDTSAPPVAANPIRNALLQESAQRLLWLYHKHLPEVVAEARFDVGKILVADDVEENVHDISPAAQKFHLVQKLHVLRTLKASNQFIWTNKTPSSRTYLYSILKSYTSTFVPALKSTLLDLLSHLLSSSILFEGTPTEPQLWLTSLPCLVRASNATSPDNANLTDEAESVVAFLDDCIQRCLKTPFRYIEEMRNNTLPLPCDSDAEIYPTPLIMTVSEQLDAKLNAGLFTPSDVLAISSFIRKVVYRLLGQVENSSFVDTFVVRIDQILSESRLWPSEYPLVTAAVRTEVKMMYSVVRPTLVVKVPTMSKFDLLEFLDKFESEPPAGDIFEQRSYAHSIIDHLRFVDQPLTHSNAKRLLSAVQTQRAPEVAMLSQYLFPRSGSLWESYANVGMTNGEIIFPEWLFYNASEEQLLNPNCRKCIVSTLFSTEPKMQSCMALVRHVQHRLKSTNTHAYGGLIPLLADLFGQAQSVFNNIDMTTLKELLFVRPGTLKQLATALSVHDQVYNGFRELLERSFDPSSSTDRRILSEINTHWLKLLQTRPISDDYDLKFAALWTGYLHPPQLLSLLDQLTSHHALSENPRLIPLVQSTLTGIQRVANEDIDVQYALWERIPLLLRTRKQLSASSVVDELILVAIDSTLPVGLCAPRRNLNFCAPADFALEMRRASSCWKRRSLHLNHDVPLRDVLTLDCWSSSTAEVIASLAYKQGLNTQSFEAWLRSEHSNLRPVEDLATVVQAALNIHQFTSSTDHQLDPTVWIPYLNKIAPLCINHDVQASLRQKANSCVGLALKTFPDCKEGLVQLLIGQVELHRLDQPTSECMQMGLHLPELASALLEWALHWLIIHLADDASFSAPPRQCIEDTISLVQGAAPKSHQVETLLGVIVQHHLTHAYLLDLANACISRINLKPVVVNRYLQKILHNPQFFKLCLNSDPDRRLCIVRLLHTLFNLHPANTCQITQVEPLLRIYHGTLAKADLLVFSLFQLFEVQSKISLVSFFSCWSSSPEITCSSTLESLKSLDPATIFRTTLHYPDRRKLQAESSSRGSSHEQHLYDPVFLVLLLHLVVSQHPPSTAFGWIELFRTNIVGLCIRTLSSKDPILRALGLSQLGAVHKSVENLIFQEKSHVIYILNLLKDLFVPPPLNDPPPRLSSYTTLLLAHALRGVFYPSNFIYPLTARFLLQRPQLDPGDVPMLYTMLYSSNADEWKKERGWIIRLLAEGMVSSDDWQVLKRRHTWDLLSSLFQCSGSDIALRKGIFEVMANLTRNRHSVTDMVLKSSFLAWIEMQIQQQSGDESLKWSKILANVVFAIDHSKLDSILKDSWRNSIYRCLSVLFSGSNADLILPVVTTAIFSLVPSSATSTSEARECINLAVRALDIFETHMKVSAGSDVITKTESCLVRDAFSSQSIHEPLTDPHTYATWLDCVTLLWRTVMTSETFSSSWDALTFRLLASRGYQGVGNDESHWIYEQIVHLQGDYYKTLPIRVALNLNVRDG